MASDTRLHLGALRILLLVSGIGMAFAVAKAGPIPDGYTVNRYTQLWEHSPFTIASVEQAPPPPTSFADKIALVATAKLDDKRYLVTLFNKDSQERLYIISGSTDPVTGIKVVSVETGEKNTDDVATIQKGSEVGKAKFDKGLLAATQSPAPPGGPNPPPPAPGAPPAPVVNGMPQVPSRIRRPPIPVPSLNPYPPVPNASQPH